MFSNIFKMLLPTGRAYYSGQVGNNLIDAHTDYSGIYNAELMNLLNGSVPNDDWTAKWCSRWESFLDLPAYDFESIPVRIARIKLAITPSDPDNSLITKSAIQNEINIAGWNGVLYVHENPNGLMPVDVLPQLTPTNQLGNSQLGQAQLMTYDPIIDYPDLFSYRQLGTFQLGQAQLNSVSIFTNKIANYTNRNRDLFANLNPIAHTFYVCGPNLGDVVTLPQVEEYKLRKLLLTIKPASAVGFLLIKYT